MLLLACLHLPLNAQSTYVITEEQLTRLETNLKTLQTELTQSRDELTTLKKQLATVSESYKKLESRQNKRLLLYTVAGFCAGATLVYFTK